MSDISQYIPSIYDEILEVDTIATVENELLDDSEVDTRNVRNNQYIKTADINGVEEYENMIGIIPNPSVETLEFRKYRLINRLSSVTPFSLRFLKSKLDEIIGAGRYTVSVDYPNYTLYIESSAENQDWFHEILITVTKLKPANIVFINMPLVYEEVRASETINLSQATFNYKLGTSWVLGKKAFVTFDAMGVIKLAATSSIGASFLNHMASFTSSDVAKVRINGSTIINTFLTKTAIGNVVTIEYEILASSGISEVTQIELLDSSDNVLTNSLVYIPVLESVVLKHSILIKEGV